MGVKTLIFGTAQANQSGVNPNNDIRFDFSAFNDAGSIRSVTVKSMAFVNALPNVTKYNNTLYYRQGAVDLTVVIPHNIHYINDTFVAALSAAMPNETVVIQGAAPRQVEITTAGAGGIKIYSQQEVYQLFGAADSLNRIIGAGLINSNEIVGDGVLTMDKGIIDLSGPKYMYVTCETLSRTTGLVSDGRIVNHLVAIPITVEYGVTQTFYTPDMAITSHMLPDDVSIQQIQIGLSDINGGEIWLPENIQIQGELVVTYNA